MNAVAVRPVAEIASYHAHIYFEADSERSQALALRAAIADRFAVRLGTVWDRPVGPHSRAMYQVAFETGLFASFVPWLMLNAGGLSVLIHPNTRNMRRDHLDDGMWIGTPLALDGEILPEDGGAEEAGAPNTAPTLAP
ncbi:MAG TPA: DOPA 4,5-dioxygenase family protein [Allosphingosinicella sp.]